MKRTSIKYIFTVLAIFMIVSTVGMAQEEKLKIDIKYKGFEDNTAHMKITLSGFESGKLIFVENYYSINSKGYPKFYSSKRFETIIDNNKITFDLYRPADRYGQSYTFVETIILNNDKKVNHWWIDLRNYWKNYNKSK